MSINVLNLLADGNFITVNKTVIKKVGLYEAILLGVLAGKQKYWEEHDGLTEDGYFFNTIENFEEETTISEYQQRQAFKHLEELGIISTKRIGIPAKKYFRINTKAVLNLFEIEEKDSQNMNLNNSISRPLKIQDLSTEKVQGNNNKDNNNKDNNINCVSEETVTSKKVDSSDKKSSKKNSSVLVKEYIDSLSVDQQLKDNISKWYKNVPGYKRPTVDRLSDMLKQLYSDCNNNMNAVNNAVETAYLKGWYAFYVNNSKSYSNKTTTTYQPAITAGTTSVERMEFKLED